MSQITNNEHWSILLSNNVDKRIIIEQLLSKKAPEKLTHYNQLNGVLFSDISIAKFIDQEYKYDKDWLKSNRKLRTFSSGERKKLFLEYCFHQKPDYIILDNPFDHLDNNSRIELIKILKEISGSIRLIQLTNRKKDILPFILNKAELDEKSFCLKEIDLTDKVESLLSTIPKSLQTNEHGSEILVKFNKVSVNYDDNPIVKDISWTIKQNEFWQLIGPNGSGKSTLISLITGDNPKAYGQEIYLFGRKKGSGESIWSIKKQLGYFSTNMTELFSRNQTLEHMILSGFFDSIGLYDQPTNLQKQLVYQWLEIIGLIHLKDMPFNNITIGQQRAVLIIRAIIKQPPLLLLDEPTEGLDDNNVALIVNLINILVYETKITILFVSHRIEPKLSPTSIFELIPYKNGSIGKVKKFNYN